MKFVDSILMLLFGLIFIVIMYNLAFSQNINKLFPVRKLIPVPDKDRYPGCPTHDEYN